MTCSPTCSRRKPDCPRPPPASPAHSEIGAGGTRLPGPCPRAPHGLLCARSPPATLRAQGFPVPWSSTEHIGTAPHQLLNSPPPDRAPGGRDGFTAAGHLRAGQLWGPVSLGASEVWVQTQQADVLEGASVHRARGGAPVSGTPRATGSPGCPDTTAWLSEGTRGHRSTWAQGWSVLCWTEQGQGGPRRAVTLTSPTRT